MLRFAAIHQPKSSLAKVSKLNLRRWIGLTLLSLFLFGSLHHLDHLIRGNHVGWPAIPEINPFTYSLLAYPLLAIGLSALTRGRVWAAYWFAYGLMALVLMGTTHFVPPFIAEPIHDVYLPYLDPYATDQLQTPAPPEHLAWFQSTIGAYAGPTLAVVAVAILVGAVTSAAMLVLVAWRVKQAQGHW
jgi:hypothetical protein